MFVYYVCFHYVGLCIMRVCALFMFVCYACVYNICTMLSCVYSLTTNLSNLSNSPIFLVLPGIQLESTTQGLGVNTHFSIDMK